MQLWPSEASRASKALLRGDVRAYLVQVGWLSHTLQEPPEIIQELMCGNLRGWLENACRELCKGEGPWE